MIKVETNMRTFIRISGHAGYEPAGQDIVCAAVSTLYEALKIMLQQSADGTVTEEDGYACIEISPYLSTRGKVSLDFFLTGIRALEQAYPQHVQLYRAIKRA